MTRELPLSRGMVAVVNDSDYTAAISAGKWHLHAGRRNVYARRNVRRADGSRTSIMLHNFLTSWPRVDHIDGNGLNNCRSNLRPATNAENTRNSRLRIDSTTGLRGVTWNKRDHIYAAKIRVDGRLLHLGSFSVPIEAALAYDAAALIHFGEFARLNFPREMASA